MSKAAKKVFLIAFFAAGVWLYAIKEMGSVPMGTLYLYLGLWFAFGIGGFLLLRDKSHTTKREVDSNPFDRMDSSERIRAIGIIRDKFAGRLVSAEESNWLAVLLERYAPHLTQSQQMERFTDYLGSRANTEPTGATHQAGMDERRHEDLHGGPAVVLARAARRPGFDVTQDGSSWFGGLPRLGDAAWPRDGAGQLMTPLAQIDLAGLAAAVKVPALPDRGSLAFFAALPETGTWSGRVVHVPQPAPSAPPGPLPQVGNHTFGGPLRRGEPAEGQTLYPRMALELVSVQASGATERATFTAEVERALGPGREVDLSASLFKDAIPDPKRPLNRDSLLRFLHGARIALGSGEAAENELQKARSGYANSIKGLTEKLASDTDERELLQARLDNTLKAVKRLDIILGDFGAATRQLAAELETMADWAQIGDRWQPLSEAEQEGLAPLLEPWTTYRDVGWAHLNRTYSVHRGMQDCVTETLLVMAVAEDEVFSRLPEPVRVAVQGPWRQPYRQGHHQMFGCPDSIQDAAATNAQAYLLLQLQCDDLAGFHWGDMGVLQFWIRPEDLEAGHWDRAYMTFEGH